MNNKYLSFFCLLALSVSGCAQHMAKQDSTTPPPAAASSQPQDDSQVKAAAAETAKAQDAAPAAPAASDAAQQASNAGAAQPAAKKTKNPTPQETAAAAKLLPLPPKEIIGTINKLTTLSRVRYLSRSAQYDYYVGGKIDAKYDINKSKLVVTNAPAADKDSVTCEYSKNGKMISDKKTIPEQKVEACNKLINELGMYLER
jgi:lipoprotein-anchoring transpeptidase ErfK/SrfK